MHHPIFKLTPVMLAFYSKIPIFQKKRSRNTRGILLLYEWEAKVYPRGI